MYWTSRNEELHGKRKKKINKRISRPTERIGEKIGNGVFLVSVLPIPQTPYRNQKEGLRRIGAVLQLGIQQQGRRRRRRRRYRRCRLRGHKSPLFVSAGRLERRDRSTDGRQGSMRHVIQRSARAVVRRQQMGRPGAVCIPVGVRLPLVQRYRIRRRERRHSRSRAMRGLNHSRVETLARRNPRQGRAGEEPVRRRGRDHVHRRH